MDILYYHQQIPAKLDTYQACRRGTYLINRLHMTVHNTLNLSWQIFPFCFFSSDNCNISCFVRNNEQGMGAGFISFGSNVLMKHFGRFTGVREVSFFTRREHLFVTCYRQFFLVPPLTMVKKNGPPLQMSKKFWSPTLGQNKCKGIFAPKGRKFFNKN